jgi:excisionase family DNA binding protein
LEFLMTNNQQTDHPASDRISPSDFVSPRRFAELSDGAISTDLIYDAVKLGSLPHIRIGRKILIPKTALHQVLGSYMATESPGGGR